jgi:hypothetical protein
VADVHDTPSRVGKDAPAGVGGLWRTHFVPFHASASGAESVPPGRYDCPTAVQAVTEVQDTACNAVYVEPVGFGVRRILHLVPSQASATVLVTPVDESYADPTAVQAVVDVHDTPFRVPARGGVRWILHFVPSQASASVPPLVKLTE